MDQFSQRAEYEDAGVDWEEESFSNAPGSRTLSDIADMATRLIGLDEEIASAKSALQRLLEARKRIAEGDIPTAMEAAGLQALTLSSGRKLLVKENLYANMAEMSRERKNQAADWMIDHGHASLVQTEVSLLFDRGDGDLAQDTADLLRMRGLSPMLAETMHTASVKSMIREMREQGMDVPLELFGAYIKKEAVIK